jgi:SAM-dependent methyltransferase
MKLNLGSGGRGYEGYESVDICPPADQIADLRERWPWEDSSIEAVIAYDIVEHLPNKIHTMNELHRVLAPGGIAEVLVPSASEGAGAFQDPTHCSFWTANDWQYYLDGSPAVMRFAKSYGITARFRILDLGKESYRDFAEDVVKIRVKLEAVK